MERSHSGRPAFARRPVNDRQIIKIDKSLAI